MAKFLSLRRFLPGDWCFTRTITGHTPIYIEGNAVFHSQGEDLIYREEGKYLYQGKHFSFEQIYYYQAEKNAGYIVQFKDKRPFYFLTLHDRQQKIIHLCGKDTYHGLNLYENNTWKSEWEIKGPRKDFKIETFYQRPTLHTIHHDHFKPD